MINICSNSVLLNSFAVVIERYNRVGRIDKRNDMRPKSQTLSEACLISLFYMFRFYLYLRDLRRERDQLSFSCIRSPFISAARYFANIFAENRAEDRGDADEPISMRREPFVYCSLKDALLRLIGRISEG